jgi:hypothetical protein
MPESNPENAAAAAKVGGDADAVVIPVEVSVVIPCLNEAN